MVFHFLSTAFAQWVGPTSSEALLEPRTHNDIVPYSAEDADSDPECDALSDWQLVESDSDVELEVTETERPVVPLHVGTERAKPIAKAPQGSSGGAIMLVAQWCPHKQVSEAN